MCSLSGPLSCHSLTVNSHFRFFSVDLILPNRSNFLLTYDQTVLMGCVSMSIYGTIYLHCIHEHRNIFSDVFLPEAHALLNALGLVGCIYQNHFLLCFPLSVPETGQRSV